MGNGKTTRANVEALIGDVVDSVDEAVIAIVYNEKKSDGVEWSYQYAIDKELPILDYSRNNYEELLVDNTREELRFFALWDDDDSECQTVAAIAQQNNIPVYDLTDGLMLVPLSQGPIASPPRVVMPVVETQITEETAPAVKVIKPIEDALDDGEEEPDDEDAEDYDSEYDLEKNLVVLVSEMGRIFARSFAKEFKRIIED
jgi:hypothetical protein